MSTEHVSCGIFSVRPLHHCSVCSVYHEPLSDKETAKTGKQFRHHWGRRLLGSDVSDEFVIDVMYFVFLVAHGESDGTRHVSSPKDNPTERSPVFKAPPPLIQPNDKRHATN